MFDTVRDMIAQHFLFDPTQRSAHGRDLRNDVDAIAVVLDHAREAADLTFDAAEPLQRGRLVLRVHGGYIPLPGIGFKPELGPQELELR